MSAAFRASQPARALAAGGVCLLILAAMMVLHAWPLWTGQVVTLPVSLSQAQDPFRGERLTIAPPGGRVLVGGHKTAAPVKGAVVLPPSGGWWTRVPADTEPRRRALRGRLVYLQLEAADGGHRPVSIGEAPVSGFTNLKGRIRHVEDDGTLDVDYGIDSYYMEEGQPARIAEALKSGADVRMQVAIARSGRARIKAVTVRDADSRRSPSTGRP